MGFFCHTPEVVSLTFASSTEQGLVATLTTRAGKLSYVKNLIDLLIYPATETDEAIEVKVETNKSTNTITITGKETMKLLNILSSFDKPLLNGKSKDALLMEEKSVLSEPQTLLRF